MKKPIYRPGGQNEIISLHCEHMKHIGLPFEGVCVPTVCGKTYVTKIGNPAGKPLILLQGNGTTTAFTVSANRFLLRDHYIYAPDVIGQAGRSERGHIDTRNYSYGFGKWLVELADNLELEKPELFGTSFGGGIVANALCYAPDRFGRSVMHMPTSIVGINMKRALKRAVKVKTAKLFRDWQTISDDLKSICEHNGMIDEELLDISVCVTKNCSIAERLPGLVKLEDFAKCPEALALLAEKDVLYDLDRIEPVLRRYYPACRIFVEKGYGHTPYYPDEARTLIETFLA